MVRAMHSIETLTWPSGNKDCGERREGCAKVPSGRYGLGWPMRIDNSAPKIKTC